MRMDGYKSKFSLVLFEILNKKWKYHFANSIEYDELITDSWNRPFLSL